MIKPTPASRLQSICRQFLAATTELYELPEDHMLTRTFGVNQLWIRTLHLSYREGKDYVTVICCMAGPENLTVEERMVDLTVDELEALHVVGEDFG